MDGARQSLEVTILHESQDASNHKDIDSFAPGSFTRDILSKTKIK